MSEWTVVPRSGEAQETEPWRELHRYWLAKHVDGRPPARGDLDPVIEIPRLVANLMILEVVPGGYEYRLVGSEIVAAAGVDLTNKRAGTGLRFATVAAAWLDALDFVKTNRTPRLLYSHLGTEIPAINTLLLLPLHTPDGEKTKILGALFRQGAFDPALKVENLSVREVPS
ncbi:MAG TPA: PAS domain-containing protein [Alphaproteobacteria bacterium]|nr:PAS domain-containing protein [Alphaproteobacteria bacterium]